MIIINYKGVLVGAPLLPLEVMGIAITVAMTMAMAVYETL